MDDIPIQRLGIMGAGRVAQALMVALTPCSVAPPLLWARSSQHAAGAASIEELASNCDVIAIAVSDDAVAPVAAELAARLAPGAAPFVFHSSGRSGASILEPLRAAGALTAAIHPAMTFTGNPAIEAARMAEARFAITGSSPQATEAARRIVGLLKGVAVEIREEHRALYHAALCHASNHLVTLLAGASRALDRAGVDDPAALLAPLVRAALVNSLDRGFGALSGPLLRGDDQSIADHLTALTTDCPELLESYRAMARATLDELDRSGALQVSPALRDRLG